jgi:hypothetical protein
MKSYMTDHHIRLVGKAWEIKHHLRNLLKQAPSHHITLQECISILGTQAQHAALLTPQRNKPREKNRDPQIIPFPSL